MRRSIARGRVFPQSYSTDRRYGRLSLKACALFPLMWANADDQGRLCGDPEEIKYAVCPNIDHITKSDIPALLEELALNDLITIYESPQGAAVQVLDWWNVQRLQWAWPSDYDPPCGWQDRLRYKQGATKVITRNWKSSGDDSGESSGKREKGPLLQGEHASGEDSGELSVQPSSFPRTPFHHPEKEERNGSGRGNGTRNSPERSGEFFATAAADRFPDTEVLERLTICFRKEWGRVPAGRPYEVVMREPDARETAQIRDLAIELSAARCPLDHIDQAFRDAAGRPDKMHISYVRAILMDWLGVARTRSP